MTDVVCGTGCIEPGTPARTHCGNTTSAPSGHLLLEEKALAGIQHILFLIKGGKNYAV